MKRILIVSDCPTHPLTGGNRACILQNAAFLEEMGFDVHFLFVDTTRHQTTEIAQMQAFWGQRFHCFTEKRISNLLRRGKTRLSVSARSAIDNRFPKGLLAFTNRLHQSLCFDGLLVNYIWLSKLAFCNIPKKAIYTHDVFSYRNERVGNWDWVQFTAGEEAKALRRFRNILAIQDEEAKFFRYLAPKSNVQTVYSPVKYLAQPFAGNANILFFSGNSTLNLEGIRWFILEVFPLVKKCRNNAKLLIGGKICDGLKDDILPEGVVLKGLFDNPSDFYLLGDIAVNPTRSGTGLKIKTIEAIAHGKYTVVHPHSAEGMFSAPGTTIPVFSCAEPEGFAAAIADGLSIESLIRDAKNRDAAYVEAMNRHIASVYNSIFNGPPQ